MKTTKALFLLTTISVAAMTSVPVVAQHSSKGPTSLSSGAMTSGSRMSAPIHGG